MAHELTETATDALTNGWYYSDGSTFVENGDQVQDFFASKTFPNLLAHEEDQRYDRCGFFASHMSGAEQCLLRQALPVALHHF
jgi:hypothetical protein